MWAAANVHQAFLVQSKPERRRSWGQWCWLVFGQEGRWQEDGVDSDQLGELLWHHVPGISNALHLCLRLMHFSRPVNEAVNFWGHGWGEWERLLEQVTNGRGYLQRAGRHRCDSWREPDFEVPHLRHLFGGLRCRLGRKPAGALLHQG